MDCGSFLLSQMRSRLEKEKRLEELAKTKLAVADCAGISGIFLGFPGLEIVAFVAEQFKARLLQQIVAHSGAIGVLENTVNGLVFALNKCGRNMRGYKTLFELFNEASRDIDVCITDSDRILKDFKEWKNAVYPASELMFPGWRQRMLRSVDTSDPALFTLAISELRLTSI